MTIRRDGLQKDPKPAAPVRRQNLRRDQAAETPQGAGRRVLRLILGLGRLTLFIVACGLAVWGVAQAWRYSGPWLAECFQVRDVYVSGATHVTRAEVLAKLQVPKSATLFSLDTASMADRVKALPWVKEVEFTRLPLHGLDVAIVERKPAGVVQGVHANVLVDEEGIILKWIGQTTDESLPLVTGVDIKRLSQPGSRERRTAKEAFELAALIERAEGQRVTVDAANPLNLIVSVHETRVLFGQAPFSAKWTLYQQLKPVLVAEHGASLAQRAVDVDLRFADRVIVRERG